MQVGNLQELDDLGFNTSQILNDCSIFWLISASGMHKNIKYFGYGILGLVPNNEDVNFNAITQWTITPEVPHNELPYEEVIEELDKEIQLRLVKQYLNPKSVQELREKGVRGKNTPKWST